MAATNLVLGPVRLSYVHLNEPWSGADGDRDPAYGVTAMIPKSNKKAIAALKAAREAAIEAGIERAWKGKKPKSIHSTLKDGDEMTEDNPEYEGFYILPVSTKSKPGIVDKDVNPILDPTEIYSGMWANLAINAFPYSNSGNQGVSFFLNHVQKVRDDEPLGGFTRAEDVFQAVEDDEDEETGGLI